MATSSIQQSRFYKIAIKLTGMGVSIIPTYPGLNGAAFDRWTADATTDLSVVDGWIANGYELAKGNHPLDADHNWVCVAKFEGVGCLDIDNVQGCVERGMPPLPCGVFIVNTPGGGVHVPFLQTDETRKLGSVRNVYPVGRRKPIFELKGNNQGWCAPWQGRADGGIYKPRDSSAPLMIGIPEEHIKWLLANSESGSIDYKTKAESFCGFHPTWSDDEFCDRQGCTLLRAGMVDGSYHIVPEACPLCGKNNPPRATIRAAKSKFMFSGSSFGFVCHACGVNTRDEFERKMAAKVDDYVPFEDYLDEFIYADDDPKTLIEGFAVEAVGNSEQESLTSNDEAVCPAVDVPPQEFTYELTDTGNGERLVRKYGKFLRNIWETGTWMVWTEAGWQEDSDSNVLRMTKGIIKELAGEWDGEDKAHLKHIKYSGQMSGRKAMMNSAAAEKSIVTNLRDWDADTWLLNVQNGVIELRTQTFRERTPQDMCLKKSNVDYNSLATCPLFEAGLEKWMCGDKELIEFLQVAAGISLTSDTSVQAIFFHHGDGENGKDTFFNALSYVLGTYCKNVGFETFVETKYGHSEHRNDLAALAGAVRMVTAAESSDGHALDEAVIKACTGGSDSVITCREIRGKPFSYTPQYKPWFMSNYQPVVKGQDWGIWRRVKMIPWNHKLKPEEKDPRFGDKLKAEGSGILNWMLEGLRKYIANGYRLPHCKAVDEATAMYREDMDIFGKFVVSNLTFTPQGSALGSEMFKRYQQFCTDNGFRFQNSRRFYAEFRKRYPMTTEQPSNKGAIFEGVGLNIDGRYMTGEEI